MGDDEQQEASAEEFATWIGAAHLFDAAEPLPSSVAVTTLLTRLSSGLAKSAAGTMVWGSGSGQRSAAFRHIPASWWESAVGVKQSYEHFWQTGDVTVVLRDTYSSSPRTVKLFDVRFEPSSVVAMLQKPPAKPTARVTPQSPLSKDPMPVFDGPDDDDARDLPPVAEAKLKRWYEMFCELYPPKRQTNNTALEHARLTFPENRVTRARIRDLRNVRKPGPKPSAENGHGSAD